MKVIILAGGSGTRLWPLSREGYPKQFIRFQGMQESLFQETFKRSLLLSDIDDIYVVTNKNYKFLVMYDIEELGYTYKEENIIVEPEAKNTLPAICAGVNEIKKKGHDSIVVFPSDHIITKSEEFAAIIRESEQLTKDSIVTFGIKPSCPNTGYGYILLREKKLNGFIVNSFKEKPSQEKAEAYIIEGGLWNAGIFLFNSDVFLNEVKKYSPEIFYAFERNDSIYDAFTEIKTKISIDYGVLEKSDKIVVVPVDIGWNDLGSFDSFYDVSKTDEQGNIADNQNIIIDSTNNLIQSYDKKIVAAIGVDDLIIIDNKDALLVCKKDQSQKIKDVVDTLKARKDSRIYYSEKDYWPWGYYKILEEENHSFKIKKISINQGKRFSYQLQGYRSEYWIVIRGKAKVTVNNEEKFIQKGECIFLKEGQKYCIENLGKTQLEIIEVQIGQYIEEDDNA